LRGPIGEGKGTAYVNGKRVTTADLTFIVGD
jgi:3-hydroxyacyl-[acyl-carrier-protein] dehydratase